MPDKDKTKKQLLEEINKYRSEIIELQKIQSDYILAKDKLSESENKYKNLIETANDAILIADAETGIIIDANKRAEDLLGRPSGEIVGMHQSILHPEDEAGKYREIFKAHIKYGHAIEGDMYVVNKKGEKIPVEISSSITEIGGRKINQGIFRDITERRKAEEKLQLTKDQLSRAQAISHVGDWEWDIISNAVHWSDELYRIYGFEPKSVSPDYNLVLAKLHPESKEDFLKAIDAALREDRHFDMKYRFYHKDGSESVLHTIGEVIRDVAGTPLRMVGMVQDITERIKVEEKLRRNEEKFRSIVDSTDDSIYMVDRDYRYLFINRNHLFRLGLSEDQYINRAFSEFHSPEETGPFIEKVNRVFKTGNSYQYEFKSIRDGMYFLKTFSPVKNSNNEITAVTVISKEITAFKYAEERLYSLTITDELTGLYNRRGFITLSDQQLKLADRDNKKMFLMSADFDYLKLINDGSSCLSVGKLMSIKQYNMLSNKEKRAIKRAVKRANKSV